MTSCMIMSTGRSPKAHKTSVRKSRLFVIPQTRINEIVTSLFQVLGISHPRNRTIGPQSGEFHLLEDPFEFAVSHLWNEVFSKFDDGSPNPVKASTTWARFSEAEEQCRLTNERLRASERESRLHGFFRHGDSEQLLWAASRKIDNLLGPFCWDEAALYFGWGPGASTRSPRRKSHAAYKYSGRPDTTIGNAALANACIMRWPIWKDSLEFREASGYCNIVPGNRIVTVPKNYKTDRTIAIEPCMNMFVQKGLGGVIRRRLRKVGIDLDDQSRNQKYARLGSIDGSYATVDLSMASDTVSYETVRRLLPPDWFEALEQCRSPVGVLPSGEVIKYQKFSSMGNGYTFELETLIFWAICSAVQDYYVHIGFHDLKDRRILVYGDDIIVDTRLVPKLFETLSWFGFTPNQKKTHTSGPFRESCGKHFHRGLDVTPFYIRRPVFRLTDLFLLHNNIWRWADRVGWSLDLPRNEIRDILARLRSCAPSKWRKPRIPDNFGDGAFIGTFDECSPLPAKSKKEFLGFEGYLVRHLAPVSTYEAVQAPYEHGYLIHAIGKAGRCFSADRFGERLRVTCEDVVSGVPSREPRYREVTSLVAQFSRLDPLTVFG